VKWVLLDLCRRVPAGDIAFCTDNKDVWEQGEWCVNGIPAGGYTIHPQRWLNETDRREDEAKGG